MLVTSFRRLRGRGGTHEEGLLFVNNFLRGHHSKEKLGFFSSLEGMFKQNTGHGRAEAGNEENSAQTKYNHEFKLLSRFSR